MYKLVRFCYFLLLCETSPDSIAKTQHVPPHWASSAAKSYQPEIDAARAGSTRLLELHEAEHQTFTS